MSPTRVIGGCGRCLQILLSRTDESLISKAVRRLSRKNRDLSFFYEIHFPYPLPPLNSLEPLSQRFLTFPLISSLSRVFRDVESLFLAIAPIACLFFYVLKEYSPVK